MYEQYIEKVQTAFLGNLNLYSMLSNFYRAAIIVIIQFCLPHENKDGQAKTLYFGITPKVRQTTFGGWLMLFD